MIDPNMGTRFNLNQRIPPWDLALGQGASHSLKVLEAMNFEILELSVDEFFVMWSKICQ